MPRKRLNTDFNMKKTIALSALVLLSLTIIGCQAFRTGSPPTKAEAVLFNVQTNYVPIVTTVTNPPTTAGQPPVVTTITNFEPNYVWTPGHVTKDVETGLNAIPVYGSLASGALGILAGIWSWFRSSKNYNTGVDLAQSIETIREFVKQLPNGATYDSALTTWLQAHQAEGGTIAGVLQMLENDVSNPDAIVAAQQIRAAIQALNPTALPPKP